MVEEPPSDDVEPDDSIAVPRYDVAMAALLDAVQSPGVLDRPIQAPGEELPGNAFARLVALDGQAFAAEQQPADDATPIERLVVLSDRTNTLTP